MAGVDKRSVGRNTGVRLGASPVVQAFELTACENK
jgi:hypothetical protein